GVSQKVNDDDDDDDDDDGKGSVIIASTTMILTVSPMSGEIMPRQFGNPPLPSPILACATMNSKLYAVLKGSSNVPEIVVADMMLTKSWDWQPVQIEVVAGGDLPNNGADGADKKGLSGGTIAAIAAVAVIVIVVLGFVFNRRLRRRKQEEPDSTKKTTVSPDSAPPTPAPVPGPPRGIPPMMLGYSPADITKSKTTSIPDLKRVV
ncbi:hypothetical protein BGZ65_011029, partial [Modicella reniformis]